MNIAQRLKELMNKNKLSNSKLAKEIGVHTTSVSRWLDGKPITGDNLSKVCAYFSVSVDYLIGATDVMNDAGEKKAPAPTGGDRLNEEFMKLFQSLSPEEQLREIAYLRERVGGEDM